MLSLAWLAPGVVGTAPDGALLLHIPSRAAADAFVAQLVLPRPGRLGEGKCAVHGEPSKFACSRCGDFACATCVRDSDPSRELAKRSLCPRCGEKVIEVDGARVRAGRVRAARMAFYLSILGLPGMFPFSVMAIVRGFRVLRGSRADRDTAGNALARVAVVLGLVGLGWLAFVILSHLH